MVKGAELDQQIYKEGEQSWGLKEGFLDVMDVKKCLERIKLRMLKKFGMGGGWAVNKIINEEVGSHLVGDKRT